MRNEIRVGPLGGAVLLSASLLLTGCGSTGSSSATDAPATAGGAESPQDETVETSFLIETDVEPQYGGELVMGLEMESTGWDPTSNTWASSGWTVGLAVFDAVAELTPEREVVPYLAESIEPTKSDFTEWTVRFRDGIRFHNGARLTADAVKKAFDATFSNPLTDYGPVESTTVVDELTVVVTMSEPWSMFPYRLVGVLIPAPEQLDSEEPSSHPIGTGPFVFEEWVTDSHFSAVRNDDYWQAGLPYLDSVEFRVMPGAEARSNAVRSGDIDLAHVFERGVVSQFAELGAEGEAQLHAESRNGEEVFVLLNLDAPPFDDPVARRALAHATDNVTWTEVLSDGLNEPAFGPFAEESPWYSSDAVGAYPTFDPDEARRLVAQWEAENGPLSFRLGTTFEQTQPATLLQEQWAAAGIDVEIEQLEEARYVIGAVAGDYQATIWRFFGGSNPDGHHANWHSDYASPIGEVATNWARIRDPELDGALEAARATDDRDERRAEYDIVQRRLSEVVPYVWLNRVRWGLIAGTQVRNLDAGTRDPETGDKLLGASNGTTVITSMWIEE